jgi:hypothetical protein
MVVELLDLDLPLDLVLGSVLNGDWEITSVVEKSELRNGNTSTNGSTSLGLLDLR